MIRGRGVLAHPDPASDEHLFEEGNSRMTHVTASAVPPQSPNIVILVTGDRHARYTEWADCVALQIRNQTMGQSYELVHGAQKRWNPALNEYTGIDYIAADVARWTIASWGVTCQITPVPADWSRFGKGAGPRRNAEMRDYLLDRQRDGARVVCLAFHPNLEASKGTGNMVKLARSAGIPVETFDGRAVR